MEILFEYKGSRKALVFQRSTVCDRIEQELRDLGVNDPDVNLSAGLAKDNDNPNCFFLQKWCQKWGAFVNVDNAHEINGEDRLTVVRKATSSPVKVICLVNVHMYIICGSS